MLEITSSSNNKCKYVKSLSQKKSRQKYGEYTIEGIKSVSDALNSEREITALYVSDSFFENEKFKYPKDISLYKVQDDVFMKTVRSSMGSFFNMRVVTGVSYEKLSEYKNSGFQLIGGALGDNTIDYRSADMKKPTIIIVGNEANGISEDVQKMCQCVKIPILGKAESLNAGVAAAILMYELVRQRS